MDAILRSLICALQLGGIDEFVYSLAPESRVIDQWVSQVRHEKRGCAFLFSTCIMNDFHKAEEQQICYENTNELK